MSEESLNNDDNSKSEFISRLYNCPKCRMMHTVKLPKDIAQNKPVFPFPYVFLHSSEEGLLDDILTVLYIDVELHIRAVEVMEVEDSNIFSEDLTKEITEKLMDKIISLEEENLQLKDLIQKLELAKVSGLEEKNPKVMSIPKLEYESEIKEKPISLEPQIPKLKEITEKKPIFDLQEIPMPEIKSKKPILESDDFFDIIKVYITSTVGPGEKKQDLRVKLSNKIVDIKDTIGNIFGLAPENFHLSSGGITFDEQLLLKDYRLEEGDEILIIPSSTAGYFF
ncbi:MAG: hypothetical protein ACFFDK_20360 [Promethearchaeota archaeon]